MKKDNVSTLEGILNIIKKIPIISRNSYITYNVGGQEVRLSKNDVKAKLENLESRNKKLETVNQNLKKINQYGQGVFDSSIGPVTIIDANNYSYIAVNHIASERLKSRLNGRDISDVTYWDLNTINLEEDKKRFEDRKKLMSQTRESLTYEHVSPYDGEIFERTLYPIFDQEKLSEISIISKNITDRKELEESKNRMLSVFSHDLNAPFNNILGFLDILKEEDPNNEYVGIVFKESKRFYGLLRNVINAFKSELVEFSELSDVNLEDVVDDVIGFNKYIIDEKKLNLKTEYESESIIANLDIVSIVYRNLISNAVKFSNQGGNIDIGENETKSMYELYVKDNGVGMTAKQANNIFEIDHSSTNGTSGEKGSGFGMTLVKTIVDKYGGNIDVISAPNKGTEVKVYLPKK